MAEIKVSTLTEATTLNDADILYLVQSAVDKKITVSTLKTVLGAAILGTNSVTYAKLATALQNLFDDTDSYKIERDALKDQTRTVTTTTNPVPDFLGQHGQDAEGNEYVAIAKTGTMWKMLEDKAPYDKSATGAYLPYLKKAIKDVLFLGNGFDDSKVYTLTDVKRNVSGHWILRIYRSDDAAGTNNTLVCNYDVTTNPETGDYQLVEIPSYGTKTERTYIFIKWENLPSGANYTGMFANKYPLNEKIAAQRNDNITLDRIVETPIHDYWYHGNIFTDPWFNSEDLLFNSELDPIYLSTSGNTKAPEFGIYDTNKKYLKLAVDPNTTNPSGLGLRINFGSNWSSNYNLSTGDYIKMGFWSKIETSGTVTQYRFAKYSGSMGSFAINITSDSDWVWNEYSFKITTGLDGDLQQGIQVTINDPSLDPYYLYITGICIAVGNIKTGYQETPSDLIFRKYMNQRVAAAIVDAQTSYIEKLRALTIEEEFTNSQINADIVNFVKGSASMIQLNENYTVPATGTFIHRKSDGVYVTIDGTSTKIANG